MGSELHLVPKPQLSEWIVAVVEAESPVHIDEVARRICDAASIKRRGARITEAIASASRLSVRNERIVAKGGFLWLPKQETLVARDRSRLPAASRKIEFIAPQELEAAVLEALKTSLGLPKDEIPSVAARYLGFNRTSASIDEAFQGVIDTMIQNDRLTRHGQDLVAM